MKRLSGPELQEARDALTSAYYRWDDLDELAAFVLDIDLEAEVGKGGPLKSIGFQLLKLTEAQGWTEMLLRDALARRPGNPQLQALARRHGLAPAPLAKVEPAVSAAGGFQALLRREPALASTGAWRKRMLVCEQRVCQVLRHGSAVGTGFLVGPDLLLSNWHVFESGAGTGVLGATADYAARFDYRAVDPAHVVEAGTVVPFDGAGYRDASHMRELDYVLLTLQHAIGAERLPHGEPRGWQALGTREFELGEVAFVLQHPAGRTLELSAGPVVGWVAGKQGQIQEHTADTEEGSSGSPCFAFDWTLLGVHHRADPLTHDRNRAIASAAILARMGSVGTIGLLPM